MTLRTQLAAACLTALGLAACSWAASATDINVDIDDGDNCTGNGTRANPYQHIACALCAVAQPGDVIHVRAGIYSSAKGESLPLEMRKGC